MKLTESQEKALEEAAENDYKENALKFNPAKLTIGGFKNVWIGTFKQGAHYQHQISYSKGVQDVIEVFEADTCSEVEKGIAVLIKRHFSAQLSALDGKDEK